MKQLIQYFKTGQLELIETPVPKCDANSIVIESLNSLISVGTEKMLLDFGKASYLSKAKQQPDKVKEVLNKIKTDGIISTFEAVWSKLNDPIPLGYSNVGRVIEAGNSVGEFKTGDRVLSNGNHAEYVKVPWTLSAHVPENVSDEGAAFTVPGAISMEGIRLLNPTLGETVVVIGLGLLGQLVGQILQANGCRVISFDLDKTKVDLANNMGMEAATSGSTAENVNYVLGKTNGVGADGIIITASTASEEMLSQCALMSRKRGCIILIGVIPITVPRNLFYEKELKFQVSSAYGPGRYDPAYEEKGIDYPLPFVRWTAKRNMEAFLFLLEKHKVDVKRLITHRFKFENVIDAYQAIENENPLGIIIQYEKEKGEISNKITLFDEGINTQKTNVTEKAIIGFIGAGNFAKMVLLPAVKNSGVKIKLIADLEGYNAAIVGKRHKIKEAASDKNEIFSDRQINTVFIATRHDSHASLVIQGIESGKHVFVEKPLALHLDELKEIYSTTKKYSDKKLMVGFNRRFSPFSEKLKTKLEQRSDPLSIIITVNAGSIPIDHWVHDLEIGGGRIIGEGCHFIDLARFFVGKPIKSIGAVSTSGHSKTDEDKVMITMNFEDGSNAAVNYLANGNKKYPKERIEIFSSERIYLIENFKTLQSYGDSLSMKSMKQNKGHNQEVKLFIESIEKNQLCPIPFEELIEIHLATFAVKRSLELKRFIDLTELWDFSNS